MCVNAAVVGCSRSIQRKVGLCLKAWIAQKKKWKHWIDRIFSEEEGIFSPAAWCIDRSMHFESEKATGI